MTPQSRLEKTLEAVAQQHGGLLDFGKLGQCMGISGTAAKQRIAGLEAAGLVRLLPAPCRAGEKKNVRKPRLFLKQCREIRATLIEEIMARERLVHPSSRFFHYTKYSGLSVDLIVERADYRIGIQFNVPPRYSFGRYRSLRFAVRKRVIERGFVLHYTYSAFFTGRGTMAVPLLPFLSAYEHWTDGAKRIRDLRILMCWINAASAGARQEACL